MSLENIPDAFADAVGINLTTAQIILTLVLVAIIVFPVIYLARNVGNATTIILIFTFLSECLAIGLGWLPFWILIMTIAIVVLAISLPMSKLATGG